MCDPCLSALAVTTMRYTNRRILYVVLFVQQQLSCNLYIVVLFTLYLVISFADIGCLIFAVGFIFL